MINDHLGVFVSIFLECAFQIVVASETFVCNPLKDTFLSEISFLLS